MADPVTTYLEAVRTLGTAKARLKHALTTLEKAHSSQTLAEALQHYRLCKQGVNKAWQSLPEEHRAGLEPPEHHY